MFMNFLAFSRFFLVAGELVFFTRQLVSVRAWETRHDNREGSQLFLYRYCSLGFRWQNPGFG